MEKITYKNVRTKVAGKPTGAKNQKSVADELIFALSKPKIKKEIKEEIVDEVPAETGNKKLELKDFQATIAKNLKSEIDSGTAQTVKLSNKTVKKPAVVKAVTEAPKKATQDEKVALKTKVNNDWINFLKKRSDPEPLVAVVEDDILEVEDSPKPKPQSKRKRNIKNDVFTTELPALKSTNASPQVKSKTPYASPKAKSKPPNASPQAKSKTPVINLLTSKKDVEKDFEKDLVLKNLMSQVAQLETSMGANISKLESQLKEEKEKSQNLEDDLESEKENYSDIATKLVGIQQNIMKTEESNKKKIGEIEEKLKSEKSKSTELTKELDKIEKVRKYEIKDKEKMSKDHVSVAAEKENLRLEIDQLLAWKEESITRIKASIMFCQEEHVQKIRELEDDIESKNNMVVEINSRASMMMVDFSAHFNLKDKEIDGLKVKVEDKEDLLKEKDKKLKDLESKMKEKEFKYREKEENEEKYKEKVDRYREKEDRYKEKEDKFKDKEKRFRDKEEKFIEVEKRLKEKEKKYKENEDKLRQKEDEMFRVYELVNQLQLRMKNDKINPIVNGQDILSIGKAKSVKNAKDDDEDVCILPTPVKVSETPISSPKSSVNFTKSKDQEKPKVNVNDPRLERKINENNPRKNSSEVTETSRSKEHNDNSLQSKTNNGVYKESSPKTNPQFTKNTLIKVSDLDGPSGTNRTSEERKLNPSYKPTEHRISKPEDGKQDSSYKSSRGTLGSSRKDEIIDKSKHIASTQVLSKSAVPEEMSKISKISDTSVVKPSLLTSPPIAKGDEQLEAAQIVNFFSIESNALITAKSNSILKSGSVKASSTSKVVAHGQKRKPEKELEAQPTKKTNLTPAVSFEEDEILLLDDEDDDIQCVMEIKAPLELNHLTSQDNVSKNKKDIKEAVTNLLTEADSVVKIKAVDTSADDDIELMEFELPEPVPCVIRTEIKPKSEEKYLNLPSCSIKSRMKASDFFKDIEVNFVDNTSEVKEMEKLANVYDEGMALDNWISKQLRLERERIEQESPEKFLDDSFESISDSSQETLKQMFLQDLELQPVDQNENQTLSKPFYVNPDIEWKLQKWPNLPERLSSSESPKPKDSDCKIVHETEVSDPRLRKKYGLDASALKMSFQQRVAMRKIDKEDDRFIPRSTRVLMLPYLWPLVKYVKKDLMQFFDVSPVLRSTEEIRLEKVSRLSTNIPIIELDGKEDEATISLLYDDLEVVVSENRNNSYNSTNFSTKRTWDEMKHCNLSVERSRILDELKMELNKSTVSNSSTLDESNSDLLMISFEEPEQSENSAKRLKVSNLAEFSLSREENSYVIQIVVDIIEECLQRVRIEELDQQAELQTFSSAIEGDDLEIVNSEVTEWSDDSFDYKCTYLSENFTEVLDNSYEKKEEENKDNDSNVSGWNKSGLRQPKSDKSLFKQVKRKSLSKGSVRRYLGSKRCFGRSLC